MLATQFPPLVKNVLHADQQVATLFLAIFSVGVAIGSVLINRLLKGQVSARYSPASAIAMGLFVSTSTAACRLAGAPAAELLDLGSLRRDRRPAG